LNYNQSNNRSPFESRDNVNIPQSTMDKSVLDSIQSVPSHKKTIAGTKRDASPQGRGTKEAKDKKDCLIF
jgi:hypothetical protein